MQGRRRWFDGEKWIEDRREAKNLELKTQSHNAKFKTQQGIVDIHYP
jgi:hypothetical protein